MAETGKKKLAKGKEHSGDPDKSHKKGHKQNYLPVLDERLSDVYKIRNNVLKMLSNRSDEYREQIKKHYADVSINDFEKMYSGTGNLSIHVYIYLKDTEGHTTEQCIVHFLDPSIKLDKANFLRIMKQIQQTFDSTAKAIRLIIVAPETNKGRSKSNIEKNLVIRRDELNKNNPNQLFITEFFTQDMLRFDWASHNYVPHHILIKKGSEEYNKVLSVYQKDKLAKILISDPGARYFSAEVGDIFAIEIASETAGICLRYRVVEPV